MANFKENIVKAAAGQFRAQELLDLLAQEPVMRTYLQIRRLLSNSTAVEDALFDIEENIGYISKPLFESILLPKLAPHLRDHANHALIIDIVCKLAVRHKIDAGKLYFLLEPLVIALTGDQQRQAAKYEPFRAYVGFEFEQAHLRYENPYMQYNTQEKQKQASSFVPALAAELQTAAENSHIDAQVSILENLGFFLGESAPGCCHLLAVEFLGSCLKSCNSNVAQKAIQAAIQCMQLLNSPFFLKDVADKGKFGRPLTGFLLPALCFLIPNTDFVNLVELSFECLVELLQHITDSDVNEILLPQLRALTPSVKANQFQSVCMGQLLLKVSEKMGWKWFSANCLEILGTIMEPWRCKELLAVCKEVCAAISAGCAPVNKQKN